MNIAYVLHGHGTGRLKAGVRTHLSDCSLVSSWRAAEYNEGGDAFTRSSYLVQQRAYELQKNRSGALRSEVSPAKVKWHVSHNR